MSRIGKKAIVVLDGVDVKIASDLVSAKGPKGELSMKYEPEYVSFAEKDGQIFVSRKSDAKTCRARHGLYRSLLSNLIEGVSTGFSKTLEIRGVGYRGSMKGSILEMHLGFSHLVEHPIPEGISVVFKEKSQNFLTVSGINKQLVGEVAANIRQYRKPEPYKGKGIRYTDEYVARKAGKSVKS
jgi:large subunit ribosomal protein L6